MMHIHCKEYNQWKSIETTHCIACSILLQNFMISDVHVNCMIKNYVLKAVPLHHPIPKTHMSEANINKNTTEDS